MRFLVRLFFEIFFKKTQYGSLKQYVCPYQPQKDDGKKEKNMEKEKEKSVATAVSVSTIGASAGAGIAAIAGGPILIAALVGAGIAALGAAAMVKSNKK